MVGIQLPGQAEVFIYKHSLYSAYTLCINSIFFIDRNFAKWLHTFAQWALYHLGNINVIIIPMWLLHHKGYDGSSPHFQSIYWSGRRRLKTASLQNFDNDSNIIDSVRSAWGPPGQLPRTASETRQAVLLLCVGHFIIVNGQPWW